MQHTTLLLIAFVMLMALPIGLQVLFQTVPATQKIKPVLAIIAIMLYGIWLSTRLYNYFILNISFTAHDMISLSLTSFLMVMIFKQNFMKKKT